MPSNKLINHVGNTLINPSPAELGYYAKEIASGEINVEYTDPEHWLNKEESFLPTSPPPSIAQAKTLMAQLGVAHAEYQKLQAMKKADDAAAKLQQENYYWSNVLKGAKGPSTKTMPPLPPEPPPLLLPTSDPRSIDFHAE